MNIWQGRHRAGDGTNGAAPASVRALAPSSAVHHQSLVVPTPARAPIPGKGRSADPLALVSDPVGSKHPANRSPAPRADAPSDREMSPLRGGRSGLETSAERGPRQSRVVEPKGALVVPPPLHATAEDLRMIAPKLAALLRPGESVGAAFLRISGKPLKITIDGPSAMGKGMVGQMLARYLGVPFFSSGIAYRVPAYVALEQLPSIRDKPWSVRRREQDERGKGEKAKDPLSRQERKDVLSLIKCLTSDGVISIRNKPEGQEVIIHHEGKDTDLSKIVYTMSECSLGASILGEDGAVRHELISFQRKFLELGGVADGRDMGTKIFSDAPVKFYFEPPQDDYSVRAFWRLRQHLINSGQDSKLIPLELGDQNLPAYLEFIDLLRGEEGELQSRDLHDSTRKHSPLRKPDDAIVVQPIEQEMEDGRVVGMRVLSPEEVFTLVRDLALSRALEALEASKS